jgi:hypothetical protein
MAGNKGSWAATQEAMESQGSGIFLKLENDGDTAIIAPCGAPLPRHTCFNEKTQQTEPWDEAARAAGRQKRTKYLINVYCFSLNGQQVEEMKILDVSFKTMTTIMALRDKYGFGRFPFEIKRDGAKNDKKTVYHLLPESAELTAEQLAKFGHVDANDPENWIEGSVPLLDLDNAGQDDDEGTAVTSDVVKKAAGKDGKGSKAAKPATNGTSAVAPAANGAAAHSPQQVAATITKEVALSLIERLKPFDADKGIKPFLAAFPYAKRVSDVLATDEGSARAQVERIVAANAPPAEVDPFS